MARETRTRSGRISKYGMCVNEECEMYKQVQEITHGDLVCEKCQKPLTFCPPPTNKSGKGKLISIIAAAIVALAIILFIIFSGSDEPKAEETLPVTNQDSLKVEKTDTIIGDVDMQTLDIVEEPIILRPGGHQQLTVNITPENQNEMVLWSSNDESVARVSPRGKVEAIGIGKAVIIAKSERTGVTDSATVSVEGPLEKEEQPSVQEQKQSTAPVSTPKPKAPATASGSKDLGYATFKGTWPNDVNGRMIFKTSHVIDSRDPKKRMAEAGDYVIGEFSEGHLVQGIWYGSDNQVKGSVIIGK